MSQHQGDEMDYAADDYEMAEVDDDMYFRGRVMGDSESDDDDEYDHLVCSFPTLNSALIIIWFSSSQNIVHVCLAIFIFSFCLSLPTKHKKENVEFLCKIFSFSFFFWCRTIRYQLHLQRMLGKERISKEFPGRDLASPVRSTD